MTLVPFPASGRALASLYVIAILCLPCLLTATTVQAEWSSPVLEMQPQNNYTQLNSYITYLEDAKGEFDIAGIIARNDFRALPKGELSFGYSDSLFWLKLPIRNTSDQSGQWKLVFKVRFMEPIDVYWVSQSGVTRKILHNHINQTFSERELEYRYLVSDLPIPGNQQGNIIVRYGSGSTTRLPMEIVTEKWLSEKESSNALVTALFVGGILTLILVNLFQYFAISRPAYLLYCLQELSMVLFIGQMEGYNFMYLWPDAPRWNAFSSTFLGYCLILFPVFFMRSFLNTRNRTPALDHLAQAYVIVLLVLAVFLTVAATETSNRAGFYMSIIMFSLLLGSGIYYSLILKDQPARYYLVGWLAAAAGGIMFPLEQLQWVSVLPLSGINFLKLGILLEAIILSAALADQVRRIKEERDQKQVQLVEMLEYRLEEAHQLARLEKDRNEALILAQNQSDQLNSASHDLRSPLYALRVAIKSLAESRENPDLTLYLEENLDYMQSLIADLLENSDSRSPNATGLVNLNELMKRCAKRHDALTKEKRLSLRVSPSSTRIKSSYFLLERILDNLLGNAVRYTKQGKILMGVRHRSDFLELQVHDTGPGMTKTKIEDVMKPFPRINSVRIANDQNESPGYGLGIAITRTFCDQLGYELRVHSRPSVGSTFSICIPR